MGRGPTFGEPPDRLSNPTPQMGSARDSTLRVTAAPGCTARLGGQSPACFMNVPQLLLALPASHWRRVRGAAADAAVGYPERLGRPSTSSSSPTAPSWTPRDAPLAVPGAEAGWRELRCHAQDPSPTRLVFP